MLLYILDVPLIGTRWYLVYNIIAVISFFHPKWIVMDLSKGSKLRKLAIIFITIFFVGITYYFYEKISLLTSSLIVVALPLVWWLYDFVDWKKVRITPFMRKSFLIYAIHPMICALILGVTRKFTRDDLLGEVISYLAYFFVGIGMILLIGMILERFMPRLNNILCGGRTIKDG